MKKYILIIFLFAGCSSLVDVEQDEITHQEPEQIISEQWECEEINDGVIGIKCWL